MVLPLVLFLKVARARVARAPSFGNALQLPRRADPGHEDHAQSLAPLLAGEGDFSVAIAWARTATP